jgi:hypothetical protein
MARKNDKITAIEMRKKGMSYSQIKDALGLSKSTMSNWLSSMPLTKEQISGLRDKNPQRIERYRTTMRNKKIARQDAVLKKAQEDIGTLADRELFFAGLALYWGEGTKAQPATVALTNTNPAMLQFFLRWLELFNPDKKKIRIKLHLYNDMDVQKAMLFWSKTLDVPLAQFHKPYIKKTDSFSLTYRNSFKMGTCSVIYGSTSLYEYIMMCIQVLASPATRP